MSKFWWTLLAAFWWGAVVYAYRHGGIVPGVYLFSVAALPAAVALLAVRAKKEK